MGAALTSIQMYIISLGAVHTKKNLDTHEGSMLSMATESVNDAGHDSVPSLMTDTSSSSLPTSPTKSVPPSPPPPPPMPYRSRAQSPKTAQEPDHPSYTAQKCKSAPLNRLTSGYTSDRHGPPEPCVFRKVYFFFFYGTLRDPKTPSHTLGKPHRILVPAACLGHRLLM